jgi:1-acyl-sn-glycerol-3-phosphate acyltransferase
LTDPLIILATAVMGTLSFFASLHDRSGNLPHRIARVWSRMLLFLSGVHVHVEGLEKITPGGSYVIASNHLSLMDTPLLIAYLPVQFRFLAKKGLFKVPFIGGHLNRSGHIPIPRDDARGSLKAMSEAARMVQAYAVSALVFPEGGRSASGGLTEFKEGAAYIAIKAGVPVVPVSIQGTREILPMNSVVVRPGQVRLQIGDAIPTAGLTLRDRERLTAEIRDRILELLGETVRNAS